jgi:hypothetical protein
MLIEEKLYPALRWRSPLSHSKYIINYTL